MEIGKSLLIAMLALLAGSCRKEPVPASPFVRRIDSLLARRTGGRLSPQELHEISVASVLTDSVAASSAERMDRADREGVWSECVRSGVVRVNPGRWARLLRGRGTSKDSEYLEEMGRFVHQFRCGDPEVTEAGLAALSRLQSFLDRERDSLGPFLAKDMEVQIADVSKSILKDAVGRGLSMRDFRARLDNGCDSTGGCRQLESIAASLGGEEDSIVSGGSIERLDSLLGTCWCRTLF